MSQKLEYTTLLEELVFWVLRYEFPQQLVTFLLGLLPDDLYKVGVANTLLLLAYMERIPLSLIHGQAIAKFGMKAYFEFKFIPIFVL